MGLYIFWYYVIALGTLIRRGAIFFPPPHLP